MYVCTVCESVKHSCTLPNPTQYTQQETTAYLSCLTLTHNDLGDPHDSITWPPCKIPYEPRDAACCFQGLQDPTCACCMLCVHCTGAILDTYLCLHCTGAILKPTCTCVYIVQMLSLTHGYIVQVLSLTRVYIVQVLSLTLTGGILDTYICVHSNGAVIGTYMCTLYRCPFFSPLIYVLVYTWTYRLVWSFFQANKFPPHIYR